MIAASDVVVGANAERSRSHNRQVVLARLRAAGQVGRAEIARASGLSTQAVSNIIAQLLDDGMIVEKGRRAAGRGLPAVQYALNPGGGYALGVEIRPDAVFAALLDLCGQTVVSERRAMRLVDRASVTQTVVDLRRTVVRRAGVGDARLLGAGVVMPGPFGTPGLSGGGADLAIWGDRAPADWLGQALGLPVLVENDANAAAIAERVNGAAQGLETYAFLYFGRGLGLGMVHQGRLMAGAHGNAGEIGRMPVAQPCGRVALEDVVSRLSVERCLGADGVDVGEGADLQRLYARRHPALMRWLDAAAAPLSDAVALLENLLDPQAIILGGAMPDALLDHLVDAIALSPRSVANRPARQTPRVLRGASGRMTATLGAAALVINRALTPALAVQS